MEDLITSNLIPLHQQRAPLQIYKPPAEGAAAHLQSASRRRHCTLQATSRGPRCMFKNHQQRATLLNSIIYILNVFLNRTQVANIYGILQ